jgi:hypothetical protein
MLAYVDPGLGLLAWQALLAALVGTIFYVKKLRTWLVRLVQRPFRKSTTTPGLKVKPPAPGNEARQCP